MTKTKAVRSIQDELKAELATLKDRVEPPSGFAITLKGKVFTLPDGSSSDGPLTCVILDWVTANVYFEGIYNPKDVQPPVCWSISDKPAEMKPSGKASKPQGANCKDCKQNEWGSGSGKGKACKNTRRLLVVPANANENTPCWTITVSPTGLKHFDKYINMMADMGKHPLEVLTDISFEESEAYPSLRFKASDVHGNLELMWKLKENGQSILHMEPKTED